MRQYLSRFVDAPKNAARPVSPEKIVGQLLRHDTEIVLHMVLGELSPLTVRQRRAVVEASIRPPYSWGMSGSGAAVLVHHTPANELPNLLRTVLKSSPESDVLGTNRRQVVEMSWGRMSAKDQQKLVKQYPVLNTLPCVVTSQQRAEIAQAIHTPTRSSKPLKM